jgi:hypothetical protein
MRTPTIFFLAVAMLLAASAAAAPPASAGVTPACQLQPVQVREITGVYRLDNGVVLKVSNWQRRLFAQLGQRDAVEMAPVAQYHFVPADRRMTMEFRPIAFGDEIGLTYPSDFNAADAENMTLRLAADQPQASPLFVEDFGHRRGAQAVRVRQAGAEQRAQVLAEGVGDVGAAGADEFVLHHARLAGHRFERHQHIFA